MMSTSDGPLVWLITGCSSGFGEEFVKYILKQGDKVIATARKIDKIQHLTNLTPPPSILQLDVVASQDELDKKVEQAIQLYGKVDVLISNAGYVGVGTLEEVSVDDYQRMFSTTIFGPTNLLRALLPHFRSRRSGIIVFNGSMWGWEGHAANTMYCSAKFALEGLAEGLQKELAPFGIKVLPVEPGFFRTSILTPENLQLGKSRIDDYSETNSGLKQLLESSNGRQPGDPVRGVKTIVDVIKRQGIGQGKDLPKRLPLGSDAFDCVRTKCEKTLSLLDNWKEVIQSSDFPPGE